MPRKGKTDIKNIRKQPSQSDITLEDFANAKKGSQRLRKSAANSINREVKECTTTDANDWEDTDSENEFNGSPKHGFKTRRRRHQSSTTVEDCFQGQTYPVDIWFLLGRFIQPEDIKVFSSICKTSYYVTSTYKFWISLYKRYYSPKIKIPDHLQPIQIDRPNCIKANVVRALFYIYPPFSKRTNRPSMHVTSNPTDTGSSLIKLLCSAVWHCQVLDQQKWYFFFKFDTVKKVRRNFRALPALDFDDDSWDNDTLDWDASFRSSGIVANPDEGFCVLRISSNHFIDIPPSVMGARLAEVKTSLSRDLRGYHIELFFTANSYECNRIYNNAQTISVRNSHKGFSDVIDFNPADSIHILQWWDPEFPRAKENDSSCFEAL